MFRASFVTPRFPLRQQIRMWHLNSFRVLNAGLRIGVTSGEFATAHQGKTRQSAAIANRDAGKTRRLVNRGRRISDRPRDERQINGWNARAEVTGAIRPRTLNGPYAPLPLVTGVPPVDL